MKKVWRMVDRSDMDTGIVKLGVQKKLLGEPLPCVQLGSFFYGGVEEEFIGWEGWHSYNYGEQLRQHLFSFPKSNASQKRVVGLSKHSHPETHCRMGVRQRLRKGFQKWWRGKIVPIRLIRNEMYFSAQSYRGKQNYPDEVIQIISCLLLESLFSVVV